LLDRYYNKDIIINWINKNEDNNAWTDMIESQKDGEDSAFKEHINLVKKYITDENIQINCPSGFEEV